MKIEITPSTLHGTLQAPASKSVVVRALIASLLCRGTSILKGYTACNDAEAAIGVIKSLGATVVEKGREIHITGSLPAVPQLNPITLHCGESGLASRIIAPLSLSFSQTVNIHGEGSLLKRPFDVLQQPMIQLGVQCVTQNGRLPVQISGTLHAAEITVDGSDGSQFLSGFLMALPLLQGNSVIHVNNLQSKPYIDLTIEVLQAFGIYIEHKNYRQFYIKGGQHYCACQYTLEGDWSGASCLLVAGAVAGSIEIKGLKAVSQQADKAMVEVLKTAGATVTQTADTVKVTQNQLHAFDFDATHCPDLFPALAVLAANCKGISRIEGTNRLATKESNRALTLQTELANIGVKVDLQDNTMTVYGDNILGGSTFAHNDHRIAMAMAVAGLTAQTPVTISGADCVNKTYPEFFNDLKSIQTK